MILAEMRDESKGFLRLEMGFWGSDLTGKFQSGKMSSCFVKKFAKIERERET